MRKSDPRFRSAIMLIDQGISRSPRYGVSPNSTIAMTTMPVDVPAAGTRTRARNCRRSPRSWACLGGGKRPKSGFTTNSNTGFLMITPKS